MKLINVNFDTPFLGLDGKEIDGARNNEMKLGRLFGNILAQETKGDALKLSGWAKGMYNGEKLSLDQSDFDKLKNIITDNEKMTIALKAQLLECIEEGKEKSKAESLKETPKKS